MTIEEMKEKVVFKLDHKGAFLEASALIGVDECAIGHDEPRKQINFYNKFYVVMVESN